MKKQITRMKPVIVLDVVEEFDDVGSWDNEPFEVLQRKIEAMMALTGATEEQAEKMILGML